MRGLRAEVARMTPLSALRYRLAATTAYRHVPARVVETTARLAIVRDGTDDPLALRRAPVTQAQIIHPHAKTPTIARVLDRATLGQWMAVAPAMERAGFHTAYNEVTADKLEEFDPTDDAVQHALANPEMYPKAYVRMLQNLTDQKAAQAAA